jgi:two-component system KDP operon response regulator KdpE
MNEQVLRFGAVALDLRAHAVTRDGRGVRLVPCEYRLLAALAAQAGRVVSNSQLLRDVWGQHSLDNARYLRIYIGHLRRKLEDDPARPRYLIDEADVGYRLAVPA